VIGLEVDTFFILYVGVGMLVIFGLWLYYDLRDRNRHSAERDKVIFHCIKCSQIYTAPEKTEEAECPKCGFTNGRLRF
jgi:uncharacterized paraquat-inducible protein A